jgi:hypothetical protein
MHEFNRLYKRGINVGGWLSQYDHRVKVGDARFDTYITEKDIAQIAGFGLDHIRLPLDYHFFEGDDRPGQYDEKALAYIDRFLDWCETHKLGVIIDFHHAPGYSFGTQSKNSLLDDPALQNRFQDMWLMLAKRYAQIGDRLTFELLNEIMDKDSTRWNALAGKLTAAIRGVDKDRFIMIGSNEYGSIRWLKDLAIIPNDERIVYAFHFYEPHLFTHQFANWIDYCTDFNRAVAYPSVIPGVAAYMEEFPQHAHVRCVKEYVNTQMGREHMRGLLQPIFDFIKATGKPLHCSEFGVIEFADKESRLNWHRDFYSILEEAGAGYSVWNYKLMNFSFVDENSQVVAKELFELTGGNAV